jgi:hypothetical protein
MHSLETIVRLNQPESLVSKDSGLNVEFLVTRPAPRGLGHQPLIHAWAETAEELYSPALAYVSEFFDRWEHEGQEAFHSRGEWPRGPFRTRTSQAREEVA